MDKRIEIEKLQFSSNKKIVLLNAGSQGIYHYYNILKTIITQIEDIQIIVICGKNGGLYQRCKSLIEKEKYEKNIRLFGFVNNIEKKTTYPLKHWIEKLSNKGFGQPYKSFLVNLDYVSGFSSDGKDIIMNNGEKIPLSKNFKKSFTNQYFANLHNIL